MEKIKELLKSKAFWFVVSITVLFFISFIDEELEYLKFPFALTVFAVMPGLFAIQLSVPFAKRFVKLHKIRHKKPFYKYTLSESRPLPPSSLGFSLRNLLYTFAIAFSVMSWTGTLEVFLTDSLNALGGLMSIIMLSLFVGSVLNVSIVLLKYSRIRIENTQEETRNSLGHDMASRFDWTISPILIISFAYSIVTSLNDLSLFVFTILFIAGLCFYSSFFSFYFLKRKHLPRMQDSLIRELNKFMKFNN